MLMIFGLLCGRAYSIAEIAKIKRERPDNERSGRTLALYHVPGIERRNKEKRGIFRIPRSEFQMERPYTSRKLARILPSTPFHPTLSNESLTHALPKNFEDVLLLLVFSCVLRKGRDSTKYTECRRIDRYNLESVRKSG